MKKLLALMLAILMVLSLGACAKKEEAPPPADDTTAAEPAEADQPTAEVPADQVEEQQALADEDYQMLQTLSSEVAVHEEMMTQRAALIEQVKAGEATEADLQAYQAEMATHASAMYEAASTAEWKTEYYAEHVAALTAAYEALAQAEVAVFDAGDQNDESLAADVPTYLATYQEQLDVFMNLLGV